MKMKKLFACVGCAALVATAGVALAACGGDKPVNVDVIDGVNSDITYMTEHFYNKLSEDLVFGDGTGMSAEQKEGFYTEIGKVTEKEGAKFKINGVEYKGEAVKLSVGKNKFVVAPRYYVEEGKLYVASYLLSLKADGSKDVKVSYDEKEFNVKVAESAGTSVGVANVAENSTNTITAVEGKTNEYNVLIKDSTGLFKMTFEKDESVIKPTTFITERVTTKNEKVSTSYGFTTEEVAGEGWLGFYIANYNSEVDAEYKVEYSVLPLGYTAVSLTLNVTQQTAPVQA